MSEFDLSSSQQDAEIGHRPLRSPPGLSYSFRSQLTSDDMTDWLRLLLEADDTRGEVTGQARKGSDQGCDGHLVVMHDTGSSFSAPTYGGNVSVNMKGNKIHVAADNSDHKNVLIIISRSYRSVSSSLHFMCSRCASKLLSYSFYYLLNIPGCKCFQKVADVSPA